MIVNIKTSILGNANTGKSSIIHRFTTDEFIKNPESTIGASFMTKVFDNIKYEIWDTAGQDRYMSIVQMYYRNSDIMLLVFDVSDLTTVSRLEFYIKKMQDDNWVKDYRLIIIGNKLDLIDESKIPEIDEYVRSILDGYAFLKNKCDYVYMSTKTGKNFAELVNKIKEFGKILASHKNFDNSSNRIVLNQAIIDKTKNSTCSC